MSRRRFCAAVSLSLATAAFTACRPDETTSLGVAERFVDQHYVRIDLEAARAFCTGLALQKVQEELRLTEGQIIDESTRKPTVRYRLIEKREDVDDASFVFQGTIQMDSGDALTRQWIVITRRSGGAWKVSNFSEEFDG